MTLFDAIQKRRSIRKFIQEPINEKILQQIIDTVRYAPTARNVQPWKIVIITSQERKDQITSLVPNGPFIKDAYACIAVISEDTKYYLEDGCAATQNILLAATALNIGSCWVAGDKKDYCESILELLNISKNYKLISLIALGYFDKNILNEKQRKEVSDLTTWIK